MRKPVLISRQQLIRTFGFSATLVGELGRPDFVRANGRWGYTYFYDLARVEVFAEEHFTRIKRILTSRPQRQKTARVAADRRRAETLEWSKTVPLTLDPISPTALERARHYFAPQQLTRERALLYLRLHYTNYLECVAIATRQYGAAEARLVLQARVEKMLNEVLKAQGITPPLTEP